MHKFHRIFQPIYSTYLLFWCFCCNRLIKGFSMGGGIALQLALRHPEAIGGAFVPGSQGFYASVDLDTESQAWVQCVQWMCNWTILPRLLYRNHQKSSVSCPQHGSPRLSSFMCDDAAADGRLQAPLWAPQSPWRSPKIQVGPAWAEVQSANSDDARRGGTLSCECYC